MKRIISIFLTCVLFFIPLVPSAFAAENEDGFVEVLDFSLPGDSDNTKVYQVPGYGMRSIFNLRQAWHIDYIDILFTVAPTSTINGVKVHSGASASAASSLTLVHVSDNLYRAYGHVDFQTRTLYFWMESDVPWVNWESCRVSTSSLVGYDERAFCDIQAYEYSSVINYVPTDLINYRYFTGSSEPDMNMLHLYIYCDNWRKYDYLDFVFSADISAINSINVTFGDSTVPLDLSFVDSGGSILNHFIVSARLDLRGLDRSSTEGLFLHVYGKVNSGEDNFISMDGCRGYAFGANLDANTLWMHRFWSFFTNDLYFNLRSILESIDGRLVLLYEALNPSTSSSNDFKDNSSEAVSDLDDVASAMDSVTRPDLGSMDMDFSSDIGDASMLMGGLFTTVISVPWLSTIIIASCSVGLLSYVLFGKE